ncbi:CrcB family protein [Arthrobacter sp. APC 3897]|uniref:fluoride efflux transporter FluC n=1 Tax=Arthrobacter sp. APC 3897 TaxID=3035204 RepID=UPI0025B3762E|nr:CrcB family protein [Arthrobacter sp. APC 3897]MDN3483133.1 CrcB family protein [Arthrobacter sp. APC 3897]
MRPPHLRRGSIGLVFFGGAAGAAGRGGLSLAIPNLGEVPAAILIINLAGAFLLGWLYEAVTRPDSGRPAAGNLKLLLGTGFCGGFTTYSSLATDTALFFLGGRPGAAVIYPLATVIIGACATWAGIAAAAAVTGRGPGHPGGNRQQDAA